MRFAPKNLFLLDAIGAIVTALLLSQVLARFESVFGMPSHVLYILASIALVFAAYSTLCTIQVRRTRGVYLKVISMANFSYCMLTLILIVFYSNVLTWLGITYFIGEMIIVLVLARIEWKTANQQSKA